MRNLKMLLSSFAFILLSCLCGCCTAQQKPELPKLAELKKITEFPPDIPTCKRNDPNIDDCIKNTYQALKPRFKDGIKELNIPVLSPLLIDKFAMYVSVAEGVVQLENLYITGINETDVEKVSSTITEDHARFELHLKTPYIYSHGNYDADIKIHNVQVNRKGNFTLIMSQIKLNILVEGDLVQREGHKHFHVNKLNCVSEIESFNIEASHLDPNESINESILTYNNGNFSEFGKDFEPIALHIFNAYNDAVPFDLFFTN